jgi:cold shock CspA family protein
MFVLPLQCEAFGSQLPPISARVVYSVAEDPKTGRPRAEGVVPEEMHLAGDDPLDPDAGRSLDELASEDWLAGSMLTHNGRFGFIRQDSGEDDMFVMPQQCDGFGGRFPLEGTRVVYNVVIDEKTGKLRAGSVRPEHGVAPMMSGRHHPGAGHSPMQQFPPQQHYARSSDYGMSPRPLVVPQHSGRPQAGMNSVQFGTVVNTKAKFGFVRPDTGEADIFLMPNQCVGFGNVLPPEGTRIMYTLGLDAQKGKPSAEGVYPEGAGFMRHEGFPSHGPQSDPRFVPPFMTHGGMAGGMIRAGTMLKTNGKFGFIQQDSGEEDMFVMPAQCPGFSGSLPPIGARVTFGVGVDGKTGRPRAEDVEPEFSKGYGKGSMKGKYSGAGRMAPY